MPLPEMVQERIGETVGLGIDGMIVYIDQGGKPELEAAHMMNREKGASTNPNPLFKINSLQHVLKLSGIPRVAIEEHFPGIDFRNY